MSLLFETIKCQNRTLHNLDYHQRRVERSLEELLGITGGFDLEKAILIPDWVDMGLYRCRVSYAEKIEKIEFIPYQFKHPKVIQLAEYQSFKYPYKFEDRTKFQKLFVLSPDADEVIITQNGKLTDATYANIALFDGSKWFTPTSYLLAGTKREYLIDNQQLIEEEIQISDLKNFEKIAIINAMRGLDLAYNFSFFENQILIR